MKYWLPLFLLVFIILLPNQTKANAFREVKVVNDATLVVKSAPSPKARTITTLTRGEFVTVTNVQNGWATIQAKHITGYVAASVLATPTSTIKIAHSKGGLVVKKNPSPKAATTATLAYNMIVEDFGKVGNGWSFVQYGNVTGYVATNFIATAKTTTKTTGSTVSVRNIASKSGAIKSTLPAQTKVHVHTTLAGWAYVSTPTTRGYVEASKLKNAFVIVIDPGHQGKGNAQLEPIGPGAKETKPKVTSGTTGIATRKPEYQLTLEASLILQQQLQQHGYEVHLTRTSHNVNISNSERATFANNKQADLFIRMHADGSTNPNKRGFSVLVPGKNNPYTTAIFSESELAGKAVLAAVKPHIILNDNGLFYRSDLSGFNWSTVPTVLIEMGFMTNATEDRLMSDKTYLTNLMRYMTTGVNTYFH